MLPFAAWLRLLRAPIAAEVLSEVDDGLLMSVVKLDTSNSTDGLGETPPPWIPPFASSPLRLRGGEIDDGLGLVCLWRTTQGGIDHLQDSF